ncbi:hypothetical protein TNCV_3892801 [Trichonephila clavipes]|nr:hypothetical protein TNCV_3892801 [Trichonephila clavipes]
MLQCSQLSAYSRSAIDQPQQSLRQNLDIPAETVLKKILDLKTTPTCHVRTINKDTLSQAHPHKDSATISIWDGGTLRVPFPSDIQRHPLRTSYNDSDAKTEVVVFLSYRKF